MDRRMLHALKVGSLASNVSCAEGVMGISWWETLANWFFLTSPLNICRFWFVKKTCPDLYMLTNTVKKKKMYKNLLKLPELSQARVSVSCLEGSIIIDPG